MVKKPITILQHQWEIDQNPISPKKKTWEITEMCQLCASHYE